MNDYNFFSGYERKKGLEFNLNSPYFLGAVILVLFVLLSVGSLVRNLILTMEINSRTNKAESLKSSDDYVLANDLQNSLTAMGNYDVSAALALKKFKDAQVLNSELISTFLNGVPANVVVVSFGMESTKFGMTCRAPNRKIAAELLQNLKATGLCQEIQLSSVVNNPDGTCVVSIDGILKAGVQ